MPRLPQRRARIGIGIGDNPIQLTSGLTVAEDQGQQHRLPPDGGILARRQLAAQFRPAGRSVDPPTTAQGLMDALEKVFARRFVRFADSTDQSDQRRRISARSQPPRNVLSHQRNLRFGRQPQRCAACRK